MSCTSLFFFFLVSSLSSSDNYHSVTKAKHVSWCFPVIQTQPSGMLLLVKAKAWMQPEILNTQVESCTTAASGFLLTLSVFEGVYGALPKRAWSNSVSGSFLSSLPLIIWVHLPVIQLCFRCVIRRIKATRLKEENVLTWDKGKYENAVLQENIVQWGTTASTDSVWNPTGSCLSLPCKKL